MTVRQIIKILRTVKPTCPSSLKGKLRIKELGTGIGRKAFRIADSPIVIKFPRGTEGRTQTRREIDTIRMIKTKKRFRTLRCYLPIVYYQNKKNAVIAMEFVRFDEYIAAPTIKKQFRKFFKKNSFTDIHDENVGFNLKNKIKVIDLGYIGVTL